MLPVFVDIFQSKTLVHFGNTNKSLMKQKQGQLLGQYLAKSLASAGLLLNYSLVLFYQTFILVVERRASLIEIFQQQLVSPCGDVGRYNTNPNKSLIISE